MEAPVRGWGAGHLGAGGPRRPPGGDAGTRGAEEGSCAQGPPGPGPEDGGAPGDGGEPRSPAHWASPAGLPGPLGTRAPKPAVHGEAEAGPAPRGLPRPTQTDDKPPQGRPVGVLGLSSHPERPLSVLSGPGRTWGSRRSPTSGASLRPRPRGNRDHGLSSCPSSVVVTRQGFGCSCWQTPPRRGRPQHRGRPATRWHARRWLR